MNCDPRRAGAGAAVAVTSGLAGGLAAVEGAERSADRTVATRLRRIPHSPAARETGQPGTGTEGSVRVAARHGSEGRNMASASYHISNLLEKMTSSDKDFR